MGCSRRLGGRAAEGAEDGDEDRDLLSSRVAAHDAQHRSDGSEGSDGSALIGECSRCFLGDRVSRFLRRARSARVTFIRLFDGEITVST
jgi:hypothetical protein